MNAQEIREYVNSRDWDGGFDCQRMTVLGEIAAHLAEINERLCKISTPNNELAVRNFGK
jgi:hypothetical protein